jgi:Fe2+ or Zn2+ uptake regulation protein
MSVDKVRSVHGIAQLSERMRAAGMRVTPQRQAIVRHLVGDRTHPTVEAVHAAVAAIMPTVSLKTVYQTVHDLESLGEVRLLDVGTGSVRVDPNVEHPHHHLVCARCGAVRDVTPSVVADVTAHDQRAFVIETIEVVFRGHCATCAPQSPSTPSTRPTPIN